MATPSVGRFAPSPTGPLHFGSLLAALASYLDARARGGQWLVRMEDIDPPREMPGAAATILRQLEQHGLEWDGDVLFQSTRFAAYEAVIDQLLASGQAYCCSCSRQRIQSLGGVYDGHCRHRNMTRQGNGVRLMVPPATTIEFDDLFQGSQQQDLNRDQGDFVIHRRDGLPAYQLAVSVDDAFQGISHVIRGSDLLDSTGRQIFLLNTLGRKVPVYGHIPVALNAGGQKLSKQNLAPSLDTRDPADNLRTALLWLGVAREGDLAGLSVAQMLHWAVSQWDATQVPRHPGTAAPGVYQH
ncbi:MAG: hypothetical protein VR73_12965 [Gammaproteobacteria bacterium BRH_c0]|nr:MAG: hypothetical protein VR73_12965 [Gammaproteobacteria bacterium BRH_c0]